MNHKKLKGLILGKMLVDFKLERSQFLEGQKHHEINILEDSFVFDGEEFFYEIDLPIYKKISYLMIDIHPYYKDILGDDIYFSLNKRVNHDTVVDVIGTQCVIIKKWESKNGNLMVTSYQLMSDSFRGFILETGGQWVIAIRFNKRSWEYYASRQRSTELALFPYLADIFFSGEIVSMKNEEKLSRILDKSLPDWYPLLKELHVG